MKKVLVFFVIMISVVFGSDGEKNSREQFLAYYNAGDIQNILVKGKEFTEVYGQSYFIPYLHYFIGKTYFINKEYEKSSEALKKSLSSGKMGEIETKDLLEMLYSTGRNFSDFNEMYLFSQMLKQHGKSGEAEFVYSNVSKERGAGLLLESFNKTQSRYQAKLLGEYYAEKGDLIKSAVFARYGDIVEKEQKTTAAPVTVKWEEYDKARRYYEAAEKALEENKYDIAKFYYKKIVAEISDKEQKSEAYFYLGRIAYIEKKGKEAQEYYAIFLEKGDITKNGEAYHNLANIYLEKGDKETTLSYINRIFEEYPFTFWETKAKIIYSLKLKK